MHRLILLIFALVFSNSAALAVNGSAVESFATPAFAQTAVGNLVLKTANYTVAATDAGSTFQLTGGLFTLTFPLASSLPEFRASVVNGDAVGASTVAGKFIKLGSKSFILWPGQTITVATVGGAWISSGPYRWSVPGGALPPLQVDHVNGSDTNGDGLAIPFATIQYALKVFEYQVDCAGSMPIIQLKKGQGFTEQNVTSLGPVCPGVYAITVLGDTVKSGSVIWSVGGTAGSVGITAHDFSAVILRGITFQEADNSVARTAVAANQHSIIAFSDIVWGQFTNGQHINVSSHGTASYEGGIYRISGSFAYHAVLAGPSNFYLQNLTINIPNSISFTQFLSASRAGADFIASGITWTGVDRTKLAGQKYGIEPGATAYLYGTVLPGATAGTVTSPGYVSP